MLVPVAPLIEMNRFNYATATWKRRVVKESKGSAMSKQAIDPSVNLLEEISEQSSNDMSGAGQIWTYTGGFEGWLQHFLVLLLV